jgi:hypothetical protein
VVVRCEYCVRCQIEEDYHTKAVLNLFFFTLSIVRFLMKHKVSGASFRSVFRPKSN